MSIQLVNSACPPITSGADHQADLPKEGDSGRRFDRALIRLLSWTAAIACGVFPCTADDFARIATPLLEKHCYACHGAEKQKGGIEVHHLTSTDSALRHHRFLENLAHQIEIGDMPPEDDVDELPTADERKAMVSEIKAVLGKLETGKFPRNPGRTTIRRLNRNEYNYTVRDLFGVNFAPGRGFPADGAGGEGFDNVGDSLFIPPILMEKYFAASRKIIDSLYANPAQLNRVLVSKPSDKIKSEAAARSTLQYHATLAFRRRIKPEDLDSMLGLFEKNLSAGQTYEQAMRAPFAAPRMA